MPTIPVVTDQQMVEIERRLTEEEGVTLLQKIEVAGRGLAEVAQRMLGGQVAGKSVILLAGPGNNGAGGLAAARHLHEGGAAVRLVFTTPEARLHEMAAHQYAILRQLGLRAWGLSLSSEEMAEQEPVEWMRADLIVDAILGMGLQGDPRGETAELIRAVNMTRRPILSFEQPSGLAGDEGAIYSPCIDATATLALALPRRALVEGWPVVGELWLADIGVPKELYRRIGLEVGELFGNESLLSLGPARRLKE